MSITRTADLIYTFRFLRLLTKKWTDMPAYEMGIIDDEGNPLKKSSQLKGNEEKGAYTMFHRLVFKLRRLLQKLPFGKTAFASYAAALFLIKENSDLSDSDVQMVMETLLDEQGVQLNESVQEDLAPGVYTVVSEEIILPSTGMSIGAKGSEVVLDVGSTPVDTILGENVYKVYHKATSQYVFVGQGELTK